MTDKVTLTKAQWLVIESLYKGARSHLRVSTLSYRIQVSPLESTRINQPVMYALTQVHKLVECDNADRVHCLRLTPAGHELARRRFSTEG